MPRFLAIGEAMVELSQQDSGLWAQGFAGDTLNTAWYARQSLGPDWQVSYFTRLGKDRFSRGFRCFLQDHRIDTAFVSEDPERMIGLYAIELTDGERSFAYWRGQSAARRLADDATALAAAIAAADLIYLSGITLAILAPDRRALLLDLVAQARAGGTPTAFDPNIRPALWENSAAMRACLTAAAATATIALPSFDDEAQVFGDASPAACAARWHRAGAADVIVKNGGGPILLQGAKGRAVITPEVLRPVDSTGAGDAFNGGYLAAWLQGASMRQAAEAAHRLACHVIGHKGALVAKP